MVSSEIIWIKRERSSLRLSLARHKVIPSCIGSCLSDMVAWNLAKVVFDVNTSASGIPTSANGNPLAY